MDVPDPSDRPVAQAGIAPSGRRLGPMMPHMGNLSGTELLLIALGGGMMIYVMLNAIGQGAMVVASEQIAERRQEEERRHAEDAAAEAAGRAAALEPLVVNADGSIAEPILALVEERS
jgi:hypothetical protein